jgi:hypothetical protein
MARKPVTISSSAPASTPKSNSRALYKCLIQSPYSVRTYTGSIISIANKISISFKYKKPSSPKFIIRTIPWSNIISYSGEIGEIGSLSFYDSKVTFKIVYGSVQPDEKTGLMILDTEENERIFVKPECLEAVAENDIVPLDFGKKKIIKKVVSRESRDSRDSR